jgi:hypothetical protein
LWIDTDVSEEPATSSIFRMKETEYEASRFLKDTDIYPPKFMASHPRRPEC